MKITFGVVAALWALALIPQLVDATSHIAKPHAFGIAAGSVLGMLVASTLSVVLFRKAFARVNVPQEEHVEPSQFSRRYNLVLPLIALTGLALKRRA